MALLVSAVVLWLNMVCTATAVLRSKVWVWPS